MVYNNNNNNNNNNKKKSYLLFPHPQINQAAHAVEHNLEVLTSNHMVVFVK